MKSIKEIKSHAERVKTHKRVLDKMDVISLRHVHGSLHKPHGYTEGGNREQMTKEILKHAVKEHVLHSYTEAPDVDRINDVFDQVTAKYYGNQHVFIEAVRAVLNFWGIQLPEIPEEQHIQGPSKPVANFDLHFGPGHDVNRDVPGVPQDFEHTFQIQCVSVQGPEQAPELYLYMCCDRVDVDGDSDGEVWECYAQVVGPEELADLMDDGPPVREFPQPNGDIASGETEYQKQVRHAGVVSSGDPEESR